VITMDIDLNKMDSHLVLYSDEKINISAKANDWWMRIRDLSLEEKKEIESRMKNLAQYIKDRLCDE